MYLNIHIIILFFFSCPICLVDFLEGHCLRCVLLSPSLFPFSLLFSIISPPLPFPLSFLPPSYLLSLYLFSPPSPTSRTMPCSHTFHRRCIDKWLEQRRTCAVCKADFTDMARQMGVLVKGAHQYW